MRGEEAGLEFSLAEGWLRNIVCVASGVDGSAGSTGCCLRGDALVLGILEVFRDGVVSMLLSLSTSVDRILEVS